LRACLKSAASLTLATHTQRFRNVAADRRLTLVISERPGTGPGRHLTLEDAVAASQPGQTLFLEPGTHWVARVLLTHPLNIVCAPGCFLRVPSGAACGIEVQANSRLANLSISAEALSCIEHSGGRLLVEDCTLRCAEHALQHLHSALTCHNAKLSVVNTLFEGGAAAVRVTGTGQLVRTRVILLPNGGAKYFFEVEPGPQAGTGLAPLEALLMGEKCVADACAAMTCQA